MQYLKYIGLLTSKGSKILNHIPLKADNYEYHMQRIAPTCAMIVNCQLAKYQAQWIDHYSALARLGNKIAKRQDAMSNLSAP